MLKVRNIRNWIECIIMDCWNSCLKKKKFKIFWRQKNNYDRMKSKSRRE